MSARAWCFTLNLPADRDDNELLDLSDESKVRYSIYQLEIGEHGTPHYQGYIELSTPCRLPFMQRLVPGAHFEIRMGTRDEARKYCCKEESRIDGPWETGVWIKGQGHRTDIDLLVSGIKGGKNDAQLVEDIPHLYLRYGKGIGTLRTLLVHEREEPPVCIVICGPTGTGKSSYVRDHASDSQFWKSPDNEWWDGYCGQEDVVLDDFYGWLKFHYMLRLLDRFPFNVQIKGSFTPFLAKVVWITSNRPPNMWWKNKDDLWASFERRVQRWGYFDETGHCEFYYSFVEFCNKTPAVTLSYNETRQIAQVSGAVRTESSMTIHEVLDLE